MAQRDDITIDWFLSPRVIRIASPSTEVNIQDLHDTVTEIESRQLNLIYDRIISTAGKENLGNDTAVGLTTTLLNAKLAFDARKISIISGTITSGDTNGIILTDAGADFSSVQPGAWVVNLTDDGSSASVISVLSETQILTDGLADGYDSQFEFSDSYRIWNVEQVNIVGGNAVAVDGYNNEISPVLPTMGTQVVRTGASSATLQNVDSLQGSSFFGGVTVDLSSSNSGVLFPVGTPQAPVNNFPDAVAIGNTRGLTKLFVSGTFTLPTGVNFTNFRIEGLNAAATSVTVTDGAIVTNTEFANMTISGSLDDGYNLLQNTSITSLTATNVIIKNSLLFGTLTLRNDGTSQILDSASGLPGSVEPIIDMGGVSNELSMSAYSGGIRIINKDGPSPMSIHLNSGHVVLDSTVTDGDIFISGTGLITNNSSVTPDIQGLTGPSTVANATLIKTLPFLDTE